MKISYSIFLAGIAVILLELMIVQANGSAELSLLYFFIIIILFFFGSVVFFIERGISGDPLREYTKKPKKRSTKSNPST